MNELTKTLTMDELISRWRELPRISFGGHEDDEGEYCLMEKVAALRQQAHTDHPAGVSLVLGAFGRACNDFLTDVHRRDDLGAEIATLDALAPRIARCAPNIEREQQCLPLLVRCALDIASGWLEASGNETLMEHAAKLRSCSEQDFKAAAAAARAAAYDAYAARAAARAAAAAAVAAAAAASARAYAAAAAAARAAAADAAYAAAAADADAAYASAVAAADAAYAARAAADADAAYAAADADAAARAAAYAAADADAAAAYADAAARAAAAAGSGGGVYAAADAHVKQDAERLLTTFEQLLGVWEGAK